MNAQAGVAVGGPGAGVAGQAVVGGDVELLKSAEGLDGEACAAPRRPKPVGIGAVYQRVALVFFVRGQPGALQVLHGGRGGRDDGRLVGLAGGDQQERDEQQAGRKKQFGHGNRAGWAGCFRLHGQWPRYGRWARYRHPGSVGRPLPCRVSPGINYLRASQSPFSVDNRALTRAFKLAAQLMELHDENPFKIRAIEGTANALDALSFPVAEVERSGLPDRTGLSKTAAAKVAELLDTGTFSDLQRLLEVTPPGVVEMLGIKGIGPKKIRSLWRELEIETIEQLREAAETDQVSKLKGFGKKTQDSILEALEFAGQSKGKLLYPQAEKLGDELAQLLRAGLKTEQVAVAGEIRRRLETVETVRLVAAPEQPAAAHELLNATAGLTPAPRRSGPFAWRGTATESGVQVEVLLVAPIEFTT